MTKDDREQVKKKKKDPYKGAFTHIEDVGDGQGGEGSWLVHGDNCNSLRIRGWRDEFGVEGF